MGGIGCIINPNSGGRKSRQIDGLKEIIDGYGILKITNNIEELAAVAEEFQKEGIEYVLIKGGDGTIHRVITAFANQYGEAELPKFFLLCGGTMCTLAKSLGLNGDPVKNCQSFISCYLAKLKFPIINQQTVMWNEKVGFMTGAGAVSSFLALYYDESGAGPWQATKVIAKGIGSLVARGEYVKRMFQSMCCRITIDGNELGPHEHKALLISTIKGIGLGFKPTPLAYDKFGHFHCLVADLELKAWEVLLNAPAIYLGRVLKNPKVHNFVASKVVIEPYEKFKYTIDGEVYLADPLCVLKVQTGPVIQFVKV